MADSILARFLGKIEVQSNGCWHWTEPINAGGYGVFSAGGMKRLAHRASYTLFMGPIPAGLELDHLCHTLDVGCPGGEGDPHRRCVYPGHLEPVTELENALRGRGPSAVNAAKTHCKNDHEFTPENTYVDPQGGRECRTCRKAQREEWLRVHHPGVRHGTETHCPQDHPYEGDNLIITSHGGRACRECKRAWNREYARQKRAAAKAKAA